ncbi:MAG: hypothetical protein KY475_09005 [Planctomycetes bacterium]|nr:hypothetical protein [Planctomycetota bacterium]
MIATTPSISTTSDGGVRDGRGSLSAAGCRLSQNVANHPYETIAASTNPPTPHVASDAPINAITYITWIVRKRKRGVAASACESTAMQRIEPRPA